MEYPHNRPYTADDLVRIITLLRDPVNGCPWDKVQTHTSIRMNFLEEAYEAVDALDLDDPVLMCEELGDVLMQVAFHTCMEQETGRFTWEQVCDGVCQKLIERHPNIFGTQPGYEGITDWDALKNKEKGRRTLADDLESVPRAMPALMRAAKLQKRAARHGAAPAGGRCCSLGRRGGEPANGAARQRAGRTGCGRTVVCRRQSGPAGRGRPRTGAAKSQRGILHSSRAGSLKRQKKHNLFNLEVYNK